MVILKTSLDVSAQCLVKTHIFLNIVLYIYSQLLSWPYVSKSMTMILFQVSLNSVVLIKCMLETLNLGF